MKNFIRYVLFYLVTTSICFAQAIEFYPWACRYYLKQNTWYYNSASINSTPTKMDWNQTGGLDKSLLRELESGAEYGLCGYIVSQGYKLSINLFFVEGQNLDFVGYACEYSGSNVKFTHTKKNVQGNNEYAHMFNKMNFGGEVIDILLIKGMSSTVLKNEDIEPTCHKAMTEITGRSLKSQTISQLTGVIEKEFRNPKSSTKMTKN